MDDLIAAAIQSVDVVTKQGAVGVERIHKIKLVDKRASLDMLSKHLGLYQTDNEPQNVPFNQVELISGMAGKRLNELLEDGKQIWKEKLLA